jgi:hypothetical protein
VWRSKDHQHQRHYLTLVASGASLFLAPFVVSACSLVLTEHRTDREVLRWPTTQQPVRFVVSFVHSVLQTPVADKYEFRHRNGRWQTYLIEETFQGQGYGLPYSETSPGETFERTADGWRLSMNRLVDPLVQLPLPSQKVRLTMGSATILLADLSRQSMRIELQDCLFDSEYQRTPVGHSG